MSTENELLIIVIGNISSSFPSAAAPLEVYSDWFLFKEVASKKPLYPSEES